MKLLELMTTEGCHLCDQALPLLVSGIDPSKYEVDLVDIAFDDELMNQYATRIPVLVDPQSKQSLDWPFDAEQLSQFIQSVEC
ncbi:hypothetical protein XMD579_000982 [Marinobacterium sp. xm-d-579]|uniref:glutaredoxin family protein n=1 Tax=Marinobacterium sp. xm-d-579 TaxID=2497734 RepID=UPI0019FD34AF|nr:hypothetical protein [Marinobacterium sp. xm-d-579]